MKDHRASEQWGILRSHRPTPVCRSQLRAIRRLLWSRIWSQRCIAIDRKLHPELNAFRSVGAFCL